APPSSPGGHCARRHRRGWLCPVAHHPSRAHPALPPFPTRRSSDLCNHCTGGYKGRVGVYQVMPVSEPIGRIIMEGGNSMQIAEQDRKSTRLNSSHVKISCAVVCLKKKSSRTSRARATPPRKRRRRC